MIKIVSQEKFTSKSFVNMQNDMIRVKLDMKIFEWRELRKLYPYLKGDAMTDELRHEIEDLLCGIAFILSKEDPIDKERLDMAGQLEDIAYTMKHTKDGPF